MSLATIFSQSATVDLTSAVSVLSGTNAAAETLAQLTLSVGGASTNQLHTDAATLTVRISVGGVQGSPVEATKEAGQLRWRMDADSVRIASGEAYAVTIESDNANDTAVEVTATLKSIEALQPTTRGRTIDRTDGEVTTDAASRNASKADVSGVSTHSAA